MLLTKHIYIIQDIFHKKLQVSFQGKIYDIVNIPCDGTKSCSLINYSQGRLAFFTNGTKRWNFTNGTKRD